MPEILSEKSSRAVKKSRLENKNDNVEEDSISCSICNSEISLEEKVECFMCNVSAHPNCSENSEWQIDSESVSICKLCSSIDRLAQ